MNIKLSLKKQLEVTSGEIERRKGKLGIIDEEIQSIPYKINKLQGYIVQHGEYIL